MKYLLAVETLESATYVYSNKTGTITQGRLTVQNYIAYDQERLFLTVALGNDANEDKGNPLEIALLEWLDQEQIDWHSIRKTYKRVWEHSFDTKKSLLTFDVFLK